MNAKSLHRFLLFFSLIGACYSCGKEIDTEPKNISPLEGSWLITRYRIVLQADGNVIGDEKGDFDLRYPKGKLVFTSSTPNHFVLSAYEWDAQVVDWQLSYKVDTELVGNQLWIENGVKLIIASLSDTILEFEREDEEIIEEVSYVVSYDYHCEKVFL